MTEKELSELQAEIPDLWKSYVERLSEYMASTGKTYKNHAATIRRWVPRTKRKLRLKAGTGITAYRREKPYD